jgi:hypothetical protein
LAAWEPRAACARTAGGSADGQHPLPPRTLQSARTTTGPGRGGALAPGIRTRAGGAAGLGWRGDVDLDAAGRTGTLGHWLEGPDGDLLGVIEHLERGHHGEHGDCGQDRENDRVAAGRHCGGVPSSNAGGMR